MSAAPGAPAPREIDNAYREDGQPLRRFWLRRLKDETGISRTGRVLEGVVTQSGRVLVEWRPPHATLGIYKDLEEFRIIHVDCHPSCNEIVWIDGAMLPPRTSELGQEGSSASTDAKPGSPTSPSLVGHACVSGPQCPVCGDHPVLRGAPTPAMIAAAAAILTMAYRGTANGAPDAIQRIAEAVLRSVFTAPEGGVQRGEPPRS